jgi:nitrite reductase/ring-hydroxylating ferredoxin subunit
MPDSESAPRPVGRRSLMVRLGAVIGAAVALVACIPGVAALLSPARRDTTGGWQPVGSLNDLREGELLRFRYAVKAGWEERHVIGFLLRQGDEVVAMSARCTHMGCIVRIKEDELHCPCHGGVFSREGEPLQGPVARPLKRFDCRVHEGRIEVRG